MQKLATTFRAAQMFAHAAHHSTAGPTFLSDHGFFGELYEAYGAAYDQVVERAIGRGAKIDESQINSDAAGMFKYDASFQTALFIEQTIEAELVACCDTATMGTRNMIEQLADDSEVRCYKIRQRLGGAVDTGSRDKGAPRWKE